MGLLASFLLVLSACDDTGFAEPMDGRGKLRLGRGMPLGRSGFTLLDGVTRPPPGFTPGLRGVELCAYCGGPSSSCPNETVDMRFEMARLSFSRPVDDREERGAGERVTRRRQ